MLVRVAEGRDVALGIELQIIQKHHSLAIELRLVRTAHDQGPVEAALDLLGLVRVRVVPEGSGVRNDEAVGERLARLDGSLNRSGSIHVSRKADAVPVNRRGLRQAVLQTHFDCVAYVRLDRGAGDLTVERKPGDGSPRSELPRDFLRV